MYGTVQLVLENMLYLAPQLLYLLLLLPDLLLFHAQALNHTACLTCDLINHATHFIILFPAVS